MFELKIDASEYVRVTERMNAAQDEIPFALALALNRAAANTRELLIQSWNNAVHVRQSGFMRYALRRGEQATKRNLRIEIYDQTGKQFIRRLDTGGTHAARGSNLAIPIEASVRIGSHGVRKSQLPRNLPNTFVRNGAIYQRVKRGKKTKLKLMYVLRQSVPVPRKVHMTDDFYLSMLNDTRTSFPAAMARAMKGKRA